MTAYLFDAPDLPTVEIKGEDAKYPLRRIFCVGRNYVAHAKEMGGEVDREAPWYFTKSAFHAIPSGSTRPYPPGTSNYHHEMELAFAMGAPAFRATGQEAASAIYAYGTALDMTRRDRQQDGKDNRRPWSLGKDVEGAAVLSRMTKASEFGKVADQRIHLSVNGEIRQDATLADMVWSCEEVIVHLSQFYHLSPGDVILTGTPAGVGPVVAGDVLEGGVAGLDPISLTLSAAE